MGGTCSDNGDTVRSTGDGSGRYRHNTDTPHIRFHDDESVTGRSAAGSAVDSPPPAVDGNTSFLAKLFGYEPEPEPENPLDHDIWKKLAIYSAQIPKPLKKKVWKSLFKTEEDRNMSERKIIIKLLKTYLLLYLTKVEHHSTRSLQDIIYKN